MQQVTANHGFQLDRAIVGGNGISPEAARQFLLGALSPAEVHRSGVGIVETGLALKQLGLTRDKEIRPGFADLHELSRHLQSGGGLHVSGRCVVGIRHGDTVNFYQFKDLSITPRRGQGNKHTILELRGTGDARAFLDGFAPNECISQRQVTRSSSWRVTQISQADFKGTIITLSDQGIDEGAITIYTPGGQSRAELHTLKASTDPAADWRELLKCEGDVRAQAIENRDLPDQLNKIRDLIYDETAIRQSNYPFFTASTGLKYAGPSPTSAYLLHDVCEQRTSLAFPEYMPHEVAREIANYVRGPITAFIGDPAQRKHFESGLDLQEYISQHHSYSPTGSLIISISTENNPNPVTALLHCLGQAEYFGRRLRGPAKALFVNS